VKSASATESVCAWAAAPLLDELAAELLVAAELVVVDDDAALPPLLFPHAASSPSARARVDAAVARRTGEGDKGPPGRQAAGAPTARDPLTEILQDCRSSGKAGVL
jgi:hypothetical protein